MSLKDVVERIQQRMTELYIPSVCQVGMRSGLSATILHSIMSGESQDIRFQNAMKLSQALECDVIWLMTGEYSSSAFSVDVPKENKVDMFSDWCAISRVQIEYNGERFVYSMMQAPPVWYKKEYFIERCMNIETCCVVKIYGNKQENGIQFLSGDEILLDHSSLATNPSFYAPYLLGVFVCDNGQCISSVYSSKAFLDHDPSVKGIQVLGAACLKNSVHLI